MQAVIALCGHQYLVQEGETIVVDRVESNPWEIVVVQDVYLLFDEDHDMCTVWTPVVSGASVSLKVTEHKQWEKIHVLKFQNKKRHRKKIGFRPKQTVLFVEKIVA